MERTDKAIATVQKQNETILKLLTGYLNHTPRLITSEMVKTLSERTAVSDDAAFRALFSASIGLEADRKRRDRLLEQLYLCPGIRKLNPARYQNDAFCKAIPLTHAHKGKWELGTGSYAAYEPFVRDDPLVDPLFREIPQIGYFDTEFRFPAVYENGVEWMSVKPNEVETMRSPIAKSHGNVLTLGLGMGYFAFHASEKPEVTTVTIVERDAAVIDLFCEQILPHFPHAEKITIVQSDAFSYLTDEMPGHRFDYLFADLWHDVSDGLERYIRLKELLSRPDAPPADYWVETSLLCALRRLVWETIQKPNSRLSFGVPLETLLSDAFLKGLSPKSFQTQNK